MAAVKVDRGIYWVGVVDYTLRNFHGHTFSTRRGTSYNAYLILDEKITLVDTVAPHCSDQLIRNIKEVVDPKKIDYIIANHVEIDHSGALPAVREEAPKAKIYGTAKCKEGLFRHYYQDWDFEAVKSNDKLKLGENTLCFVEAPMLHWPDSMFTYLEEKKILMPNDAFGQHYATSKRFDSEVDNCELAEEAKKYYANILWPFSGLITRKLDELQKLEINPKIIAPSHGVIWKENPGKIVNSYRGWAAGKTKEKVVVVFETMWGSTEKMAKQIAEAIAEGNVEVKLHDINKSDLTDVIADMLDAAGFLIGSSTHDNGLLPNISAFLTALEGLKPKTRKAAAFGSYGWAGGATAFIEKGLSSAGAEIAQPALEVRYVPDSNAAEECRRFGRSFIAKLKNK